MKHYEQKAAVEFKCHHCHGIGWTCPDPRASAQECAQCAGTGELMVMFPGATKAVTATQLMDLVDKFDWASYNDSLMEDLNGNFRAIVKIQGQRAAVRAGLDKFTYDDPFVEKTLTTYVGERITQLDETTRGDVSLLVRNAVEAGTGSATELGDKIADLVREKFDGYADWRADRIARTETGIGYNIGNVLGYREAGVEKVRVIDGDQDEECAKANGQVWTLAEALANPLAHPNCERDFAPEVD
jgi:hypothetical protein